MASFRRWVFQWVFQKHFLECGSYDPSMDPHICTFCTLTAIRWQKYFLYSDCNQVTKIFFVHWLQSGDKNIFCALIEIRWQIYFCHLIGTSNCTLINSGYKRWKIVHWLNSRFNQWIIQINIDIWDGTGVKMSFAL